MTRSSTAAEHDKQIALMKFLSKASKRLGVGNHVYVVGGAVRNWVIDEPIKDIDIVVDSIGLGRGRDSDWFGGQLKRSIPAPTHLTTNQYGVAILTVKGDWYLDGENLKGEVIEIANARKESYGKGEGKGYKPHMVEPATIEEDVIRREFSFNCMAGDTLIPTEKGLLRIDEIASREKGVHQSISLTVAGREGAAVAVGWQYSGFAPTLRVDTEWGYTFSCTHQHPVLVLKGHDHEWVQADQLRVGDLLCVPASKMVRGTPLTLSLPDPIKPRTGKLKIVEKPEEMTPDLAFVLGCIISEGSNTHQRVSFSNTDPVFISRYADCFQRVFGFRPSRNKVVTKGTVRSIGGVDFIARKDGFDLYADSKTIIGWLGDLGLYCGGSKDGKSASHHKRVPWSILQADERSQLAFLAAYLEGDGSIRPDSGRIVFFSSSPQILQGLQALIGSHGILSKVYRRNGALHLTAKDSSLLWSRVSPWKVTKEFDYGTRKFKSRNGYGISKDHLSRFLRSREVEKSVNPNTGKVPLANLFRTDEGREVKVKGAKEHIRTLKKLLHDAYRTGHLDPLMESLRQISPSEAAKLQRIFELGYHYLKVRSVEDAGDQDVYDLSMGDEVEPAFVANGVIVHNTLLWRMSELAEGPDKAEILDITGCGLRDLQRGEMRCPSDPDKTFSDDPTRMLRAIKFLTKYNFTIPDDVAASIRRNAPKLKNPPPTALSDLIIHTLLQEKVAVRSLREMKRLGLLKVIQEIFKESKPFRRALLNHADKMKFAILFEFMDAGFPPPSSLGFLSKVQRTRFREVVVQRGEGFGKRYLAALRQAGKVLDMGSLVRDLGLRGGEIEKLRDLISSLLLDDPDLLDQPRDLEAQVRLKAAW